MGNVTRPGFNIDHVNWPVGVDCFGRRNDSKEVKIIPREQTDHDNYGDQQYLTIYG